MDRVLVSRYIIFVKLIENMVKKIYSKGNNRKLLIISPDKARKGVIYPLKTGIYAMVGIS